MVELTVFANLDLCSSYWQMPLDPENQPLLVFLTSKGLVMSTRTSQGACTSAAGFQENSTLFF